MIKVLIVDSDKRGNTNLEGILNANPEFELIGIVEAGKAGFAQCRSIVPNIIIIGAKLADMPSSEFIKAIIHRYPSIGIVAASYGADVDWMETMLRLGIRSLVNKPLIPETMLDAIRFAAANPPTLILSQKSEEQEGQNPINVLIVDENTQEKKQLKSLLESNPKYVLLETFESGKEAIVSIARLKPDIVIVGSYMADMCREDLIKAIIVLYPKIGIVTDSSQDPDIIQSIMLLGIRFMINRPCDPTELDIAITYAKKYPLNGLRLWNSDPKRILKARSKKSTAIAVLLIADETTDPRLQGILQENSKFEYLGSFQTGKEALAACAETLPEVIVLGVQLRDMADKDFVRAILNLNPSIGFLQLWHSKNPQSLEDMMRGFQISLLKTNNAASLYRYICFAEDNPPKLT